MLNNFASEASSFSCVCCTTWANQEKEGAAMVEQCLKQVHHAVSNEEH